MKSKSNILAAILAMVLISIFNFIILQTNILQDAGFSINTVEVLVASKNIYKNEMIDATNTKLAHININDILTDENGNYSQYILTNPKQLDNGYMATANIMAGEQIPNTRFIKKTSDAQDTKTKLLGIPMGYDPAATNALWKGDTAELWYSINREGDKDDIITKLFPQEIIVVALKDDAGYEVNTIKSLPPVIPSRAIIYVNDEDIITIKRLQMQGASFFFIKSAY